MKLLDECREISADIKAVNEKIEEISLSISAPKNQSFDDMPKSSSSFENPIEKYIERKEQLEEDKKRLIESLDNKWDEVCEAFKPLNIPVNEMVLLYYRFHEGHSWKMCGKLLNWNENKLFRTYRKIIDLYNAM